MSDMIEEEEGLTEELRALGTLLLFFIFQTPSDN